MIRLLFITSGLGVGGAEIVLLDLLSELDRTRFSPQVVSLTGAGEIGQRITELGIPVLDLDIRRRPMRDFLRLARHVRQLRPDVVQTWMYHADLIGSLAARLGGARRIAWGIHNSSLSAQGSRRSTVLVRRLAARLSRVLPQTIISCSEVARALHVELGYENSRFRVIGNGFDLERFRPDPTARTALREELGLAPATPVVINVGRYDPQKNQAGFVRAAALLHRQYPDAHFVLVGKGLNVGNAELAAAIARAGIGPAVHLLDLRRDTPQLIAGSDLLVLASGFGEAFPLVLGEAMSCGVPCVTTDVGDSRLIVGDTGIVVPPLDDTALAEAMHRLLALPAEARAALGRQARARIVARYDIRHITRQYEAVYLDLARDPTCAA